MKSIWLGIVIVAAMTVVDNSQAQQLVQLKVVEQDGQQVLRIETVKNHKEEFLKIGQTISFRKKSELDFVRGKITGIADSTITCEVKQQGNVTVAYADLDGIRIQRGVGRKVLGSSLFALGTILLVDGLNKPQSDASGVSGGLKTIEEIISIPMMATGVVIFAVPKSIKFQPPGSTQTDLSQRIYKKFKVGLGGGYVGPYESFAAYVEPMYRIIDEVAVGLKYEMVSGKTSTNSIALAFQYYFGKEKFRPFIGGGVGSYSSGGTGFFPRAGFDYKNFNFTFDANLLPSKTVPVYDSSGSLLYYSEKKYEYFAIKLGYSIGGGRKK